MGASAYDVIVIGAGINGLTAAAYLAGAGRRVLVVERRGLPGGVTVTEEIAPGFRLDACMHDVGWIAPSLFHELGLERFGVQVLQPDPTVFTPLRAGRHLLLWRDPARTAESLRQHSPVDAERWAAFTQRMRGIARFLERLYDAPPPAPTATGPRDLLALLGIGWRLRGLGKTEMVELLRILPMPAWEFLDEWFQTDALKGTLAASAVTGILQGPRSAGTAFVLLHHHVGSPAGVFRARGLVGGGVGKLVESLVAVAQQRGVEIRYQADVARVLVQDGRAAGVELSSGEQLASQQVSSSADPHRTFLDLVGPMYLDPEFVRGVQNIKFRGACAKVNLVLGELPRFADTNGEPYLGGTISVSPSLEYLERAYDDAKHGDVSSRPYLEATIPSLHDATLSMPGTHVMSIHVQYAPYHLKRGSWDATRREALGDLVIETLGEYAPNLRSAVIHRQVLTPRDLEERHAVTEGNLYHGELTLDQILFMRPVPGWSRYRTPIDQLYLCGAGTHPGRGIAGGAGRLAARQMLSDAKSARAG